MFKLKLLFTLLILLSIASSTYSKTATEKSIFVVGSTSAGQLFDSLEQSFYNKTGYKLIVRAIGSNKGVIAVAEGVSDVGIISRFLTPAEQNRFPQLAQITIAQDAIVFITNEKNKQKSLRRQDIIKMYTSNDPIWPATGNKALLLSKNLGHGTLDSFIDFFGLDSVLSPDGQGLLFKPAGINFLYSKNKTVPNDRINQAIAYTSREPNALAFESMGAFTRFMANKQDIRSKLLNFEGIPVLKDGKLNLDYPVKRPLNILINHQKSAGVDALIAYLQSDEAKEIIEQHNFIAVN
ncbi:substrate-binding domain-containing protein [Thalassotalea marina]|uniref:PBP domain-containing protein n=1 Tax=Thalassotalea marina TaxID=1673741 RepID=A0A919BJA2_9GAMM|nr:substrate-binding domain-containing protein [Thalassotalea marina]GHF95733.1 hypothetical protein GCM10017161_25060 [Thalassotalea marina]